MSAVLVTMPHSHYVEKARWVLDWHGLPYREERHVPLLHRFATRRYGGGSVPVLALGEGRFVDSTDIAVQADALCGGNKLFPGDAALRRDAEALEAQFDEELGPHTRRWAYSHLLSEPRLLRRMMTDGVPRWQALALPLILPLVRGMIRKHLRITPESAQRSLEHVHRVFGEVDARLGDGRSYLVGNRFSIADLTFAALAAPMLFPPQCRAAFPALDAVPAAAREEILRLRETAAGRFALRMFAEERRGP